MLSVILNNTPIEWSRNVSYSNKSFIRIPVDANSTEYLRIKLEFESNFPDGIIREVERVQHPYAFARYKIRKEQLAAKYGYEPSSERVFVSVDSNYIDVALKYNCDSRRTGVKKFAHLDSNGYLLAMQKLNAINNERDSNLYPEYLVKYQTRSRAQADVDEVSKLLYNFRF